MKTTLWISYGLSILLSAVILLSLPDIVPLDWDINGNITDYGSKYFILLFPLITSIMTIALYFTCRHYEYKKEPKDLINAHLFLAIAMNCFFVGILMLFFITAKYAGAVDINKAFALLFGAFLAFLSYGIGMVRTPNPHFGIKFPWVLEDKEIWIRTHKLTQKLGVGAGLFIIALTMIVPDKSSTILFIAIGMSLVIFIVPGLIAKKWWNDKYK